MSDSELSMGQPVFPNPDRQAATEAEATSSPADTSAGIEAESPKTVEISGRPYTEDQLKEALEGSMRQGDYTRKTQELAEARRQMDQERQAFESQRAELQAQMEASQSQPESGVYDDPNERHLKQLSNQMSNLTEAFQRREAKDQETLQRFEAEEALEQDISQFRDSPFFNADEVKQYMQATGLQAGQARVAYNALYGGRIGEQYGHMQAVKQGASTPSVMGAGPSAISPGFTHPSEVPGAGQDLSNYSMRDLAKLAAEDPNIPGGG